VHTEVFRQECTCFYPLAMYAHYSHFKSLWRIALTAPLIRNALDICSLTSRFAQPFCECKHFHLSPKLLTLTPLFLRLCVKKTIVTMVCFYGFYTFSLHPGKSCLHPSTNSNLDLYNPPLPFIESHTQGEAQSKSECKTKILLVHCLHKAHKLCNERLKRTK